MPARSSPQTAFYKRYALKLIRDAKARQEMPFAYPDLADRLRENGLNIDYQVLINRINRGSFSFAFALQVLAALGESHIVIPSLPDELKKKPRSR